MTQESGALARLRDSRKRYFEHRIRIKTLRARLYRRDLQALLVLEPANIRYLTGFASIAYSRPIGCLVPAAGRVHLVVPRIELAQAREMTTAVLQSYPEWSTDRERFPGFDRAFGTLVAGVMRKFRIEGRLGIEDTRATRPAMRRLLSVLRQWRPVLVDGLVEEGRMCKSAEEVGRIRDAAAAAMAGMRAAWKTARPGVAELAVKLRGDLIAAEYAREYFPQRTLTISSNVLSGARIAAIHSPASNNRLERGDLAYLAWMVAVDGYWVELARTVPIGGAPTTRQRALHRVVAEIHGRVAQLLRPGTVADDVDLVARSYLAAAGLARYSHHRTGHGVGLMGVERPNLGVGDATRLHPNMVVSIEPSVYIEGFGGMGASDTLLITASGPSWLTPREFLAEAWED